MALPRLLGDDDLVVAASALSVSVIAEHGAEVGWLVRVLEVGVLACIVHTTNTDTNTQRKRQKSRFREKAVLRER